jgi:hypothetical protein
VCQFAKDQFVLNATEGHIGAVLGIDFLACGSRYSNIIHDHLRPSPYE